MSNNDTKFACKACDKSYSFRHNLYRHISVSHPTVPIEGDRKPLKCPICEFTPKSAYKLTAHLTKSHNIQLETCEMTFTCESDFLKWKSSIESSDLANFTKVRGNKITKDGSCVSYYKCHRSGKYVSKSNGKRSLKTQGSNKINGICPANIKFIKTKTGNIVVHYQKTHVGHENDLGHLYLSIEDKVKIARKIASNISPDVILDDVRNSLSDSKVERIHLLTKQDLHNIEKCYNLSASVKHNSTSDRSIDEWVDEMKQSENCCVVFYKSCEENHQQLDPNDIVLVIMNDAQCEMLKKYGNNHIYIDRTKNLNAYNCEMVTLMVLDDLKQGFPCAFLVTNTCNAAVTTLFFTLLRDKVGPLNPTVLASDTTDCFHNSWSEVMGKVKYSLYTPWDVDEDWTSHLTTITNRSKQVEVYSLLKNLFEEVEFAKFETLLHEVISNLFSDQDTADFATFFYAKYAKNFAAWAKSYWSSVELEINTVHLEKLHRTINYLYLQGKNVKHLDRSIHAIMQFVRDKLIDRFMMLNKSKLATHLKLIKSRHKGSFFIHKKQVVMHNNYWKIRSTSGKELHTIQEVCANCDCKITCPDCQTCVHQYTCSCVDSAIRWNMCKHIHLICRIKSEGVQEIGIEECSENDADITYFEDYSEELEDVSTEFSNKEELDPNISEMNTIEVEKDELRNCFDCILGMVETADQVAVVKKHLDSIISIIKPTNNSLSIVSNDTCTHLQNLLT